VNSRIGVDRYLRRIAAIVIYVLALGFEGFWIAGANFFSNGRDASLQSAIVLWWCVFVAIVFLWRLPGITMVASAASLIARMIWVWPTYLQIKAPGALLFGAAPDLVLIAASWLALRRWDPSK
jgi:hypothetical protein